MTAEQVIDYEALAQTAMRGVVRAVLARVAKSGLPSEHHFYIAFNTQAPGVVISKRLKEKYPEEMTIVLQHRFWDLNVTEERFEVKLTFDSIPERLTIPFAAIKVFFDPSVPYGLQFEDSELAGDKPRREAGSGDGEVGSREPRVPALAEPATARPVRNEARGVPTIGAERTEKRRPQPRRPKPEKAAEPAVKGPKPPVLRPPIRAPQPAVTTPATVTAANEEKPGSSGGAKIVSLDQFRKK
jgi:hypothetical protein